MAQRLVNIPGIGEAMLARRKGTKHIRLSINAEGQLRISVPNLVPFAAGIAFARSRRTWIEAQQADSHRQLLREGMRIGKAHRLHFLPATTSAEVRTRISPTLISIYSDLPLTSDQVQGAALKAAERALKAEAEQLLPQRLATLASQCILSYSGVSVKKLSSRWGSCSSKRHITLSFYLMQLPWNLIDYVLLHELAHTQQMNHGPKFWGLLESFLPNSKSLKKELRGYKPRVEPQIT